MIIKTHIKDFKFTPVMTLSCDGNTFIKKHEHKNREPIVYECCAFQDVPKQYRGRTGVYIIVDEHSKQILYVGKTDVGLYQRWKQYNNPGPTQYTNMDINSRIYKKHIEGIELGLYFHEHENNHEITSRNIEILITGYAWQPGMWNL